MFYGGMVNVPGAPGNLMAGGNFMGGEGLQINPEAHKQKRLQQKIYNKGIGTDNLNEREIFLRRTGPQLPMAGIGNVGGMLAQAYPLYGDTIDMGTAPGTYSNMPVIPDEVGDQFERDALFDQYRNRVFPPTQIPAGFDGKYVS